MKHSRACPVCGAGVEKARLFLKENITPEKLTGLSFASRKEPERMNHQLMQCTACDLVFVDLPPEEEKLAHAYAGAEYDSSEEANDAANSYIRIVEPLLHRLAKRESALEIGTGTGIFLEHLSRAGFSRLSGVEPSSAAIEKASPAARAWIREGLFNESDYAPGSFDLICCFMTMEHVLNPGALAQAAYRLLRPGGAFVVVAHDYRAFVNRMLGARSPIIDIEHMQLFSARSMQYLLDTSGYKSVAIHSFANSYSVHYWVRLLPITSPIKRSLQRMLAFTGLHKTKITLNVGNIAASGIKSAA
jgi:SAM-dependent methyltransferase